MFLLMYKINWVYGSNFAFHRGWIELTMSAFPFSWIFEWVPTYGFQHHFSVSVFHTQPKLNSVMKWTYKEDAKPTPGNRKVAAEYLLIMKRKQMLFFACSILFRRLILILMAAVIWVGLTSAKSKKSYAFSILWYGNISSFRSSAN